MSRTWSLSSVRPPSFLLDADGPRSQTVLAFGARGPPVNRTFAASNASPWAPVTLGTVPGTTAAATWALGAPPPSLRADQGPPFTDAAQGGCRGLSPRALRLQAPRALLQELSRAGGSSCSHLSPFTGRGGREARRGRGFPIAAQLVASLSRSPTCPLPPPAHSWQVPVCTQSPPWGPDFKVSGRGAAVQPRPAPGSPAGDPGVCRQSPGCPRATFPSATFQLGAEAPSCLALRGKDQV